MANTYSQIHIQAIFAVQNRACVIQPTWKDELYKYVTGIIKKNGHRLLAINGMPDHVHVFFGMRPVQSISDLLQDIKGSSSKWINNKRFINSHFTWQEGYGAFSYSKSDVDKVIEYIKNQEQHHKKISFKQEYINILNEFGLSYDDHYIFKSLDDEEV